MAKVKDSEPAAMDRRKPKDRRVSMDRRKQSNAAIVERRKTERRKVPRRRQIDPTTCERDYTDDEVEFMNAMDDYKRRSGRMFPTCSEILEVLRDLGYQKGAAAIHPAPQPAAVGDSSESDTVVM